MKLRDKVTKEPCEGSAFNTHSLSEIIVMYKDGGQDSAYIKDFEVEIHGVWKLLSDAFADKDIVPNNYNTHFGPPRDSQSRERGYNP